jgi:RimJ/RimL family protein N-acetyltransferase
MSQSRSDQERKNDRLFLDGPLATSKAAFHNAPDAPLEKADASCPMLELETERLILRPLGGDDLDDLAALQANAEVVRHLGGRLRTRGEMAERLEKILDHWRRHGFGIFALLEKASGRFVGYCGVAYLHGLADAEVTYGLASPFWGHGLATEALKCCLQYAFEEVGLPRVVGVAVVENVASQRVMEKAGMALQGPYEYDSKQGVLFAIDNPAIKSPQ